MGVADPVDPDAAETAAMAAEHGAWDSRAKVVLNALQVDQQVARARDANAGVGVEGSRVAALANSTNQTERNLALRAKAHQQDEGARESVPPALSRVSARIDLLTSRHMPWMAHAALSVMPARCAHVPPMIPP